MLIPEFFLLEGFFVLLIVNFLENVLKPTVVFFHDSVLGGQVKGIVSFEGEFEATVGESFDAFICVVHSHSNSSLAGEVVDFKFLNSSIIASEGHLEFSRFGDNKICSSVLITVSVSTNNDGFLPAGDQSGNILDDNGFSEDSTVENVSDSSIR